MAQEAKPLIRKLKLKQRQTRLPYRQYADANGEMLLTVMGIGPVAAAGCVGAVLGGWQLKSAGEHGDTEPDMAQVHLILFGTAAGSADAKGLYLVHKLTNADSGRMFYPDLLIESDLPEAEIVTSSKVMSEKDIRKAEPESRGVIRLYDMEAAAVYEAGSRYLGPHQMSFLKCVSDHGISLKSILSLRQMSSVLDESEDKAIEYLQKISHFLEIGKPDSAKEQAMAEDGRRLDEAFHASEAMHFEIRQLLRYAYLNAEANKKNGENPEHRENLEHLISDYTSHPAKDRREGKKRLDEFRKVLTR